MEAINLTKVYHRGSEDIPAVHDVSLRINRGDFVSFIGPSGSGKTTLVNLLGCLDNPTSGELLLDGRRIFSNDRHNLSERKLTEIRRELFGYIFQNFYLIPTLTVMENVMLPLTFYRKTGRRERCDGTIKTPGHRPSEGPFAGPDFRRRNAAGGDSEIIGQLAGNTAG